MPYVRLVKIYDLRSWSMRDGSEIVNKGSRDSLTRYRSTRCRPRGNAESHIIEVYMRALCTLGFLDPCQRTVPLLQP